MPSPDGQEIGGRFRGGADHQYIQQVAVMHFDGAGMVFNIHCITPPLAPVRRSEIR